MASDRVGMLFVDGVWTCFVNRSEYMTIDAIGSVGNLLRLFTSVLRVLASILLQLTER